MNRTTQIKRLLCLLAAGGFVGVCFLLLTLFPGRASLAPDIPVIAADISVTAEESAETAAPETEPIPETTTETTADTTAAPETEPQPLCTLPDDETVVFSFLGLCAPGSPLGTQAFGSLNARMKNDGAAYFLAGMQDVLAADDFTFAFHTAFLSDTASSDSLTCAGPASNAEIYRAGSVELVSLAGLCAEAPIGDTVAALDAQSIYHMDHEETLVWELKGLKIAVVCMYVEKAPERTPDLSAIRNAAKDNDYVVVLFRCTDSISARPEEWLRASLCAFADAGASLIVGGRSGAMLPVEEYKDAKIVYSLGTLLDGASRSGTQTSLVLRLLLRRDGERAVSGIEWIPCSIPSGSDWQPCPITDPDERTTVLASLELDSES